MKWLNRSLTFVIGCTLLFAVGGYSPPAAAQQSPEEMQQLVAPIALYPDPLVAQILAASTYPAEVVEAWRWVQGNPDLSGQTLADAVDPQPWDPSVKAVAQFPSVLDSMNKNLAWTSALGDAYVNQPQDVLDAVQALRQRARSAGTLQSTNELTVSTDGPAIAIAPAEPDIVYVPEYDPWLVYGTPLDAYPGWVGVPGVFHAGPYLYSGVALGVGLAAFGWGWHNWGFDWRGRRMTYHHAPYFSHTRTFVDRHAFNPGSHRFEYRAAHSDIDHPRAGPHVTPFGRAPAFDGSVDARTRLGRVGIRSGAFSGFDHGGIARGYASRGRSSFGRGFNGGGLGANSAHAGGFGAGGMHAGGSHGGGGGHGGGFGGRGGGVDGGGGHGGGGGGGHGGGGGGHR